MSTATSSGAERDCTTSSDLDSRIMTRDALKALIGSANYGAKNWVYEQYDSQVMADTVRKPGLGAGVVRVHGLHGGVRWLSG